MNQRTYVYVYTYIQRQIFTYTRSAKQKANHTYNKVTANQYSTCSSQPQGFAMHGAASACTTPAIHSSPASASLQNSRYSRLLHFRPAHSRCNPLSTVVFWNLLPLLLPLPIFSCSNQRWAFVFAPCNCWRFRLSAFTVSLANRFSTSARFSSLAKWRFRIFSLPSRSQHQPPPLPNMIHWRQRFVVLADAANFHFIQLHFVFFIYYCIFILLPCYCCYCCCFHILFHISLLLAVYLWSLTDHYYIAGTITTVI